MKKNPICPTCGKEYKEKGSGQCDDCHYSDYPNQGKGIRFAYDQREVGWKAKFVLLMIGMSTDNGDGYPSVKTIMKFTGLKKHQVESSIQILSDKGLLGSTNFYSIETKPK